MAMLEIILPLSLIKGSILMLVNTIAASPIHVPFSIIDVSLCMNELALPTCSVKRPIAYVLCSIWPGHSTKAVSEVAEPLAFIDATCLILISRPKFSSPQWIKFLYKKALDMDKMVKEVTYCLTDSITLTL
jgi:hypothetical protein